MAQPSTADEVRSLTVLVGHLVQLNTQMHAKLTALEAHHAKPSIIAHFAEDPWVRRGLLVALVAVFCLSVSTCASVALRDGSVLKSAIEATAPAMGNENE